MLHYQQINNHNKLLHYQQIVAAPPSVQPRNIPVEWSAGEGDGRSRYEG